MIIVKKTETFMDKMDDTIWITNHCRYNDLHESIMVYKKCTCYKTSCFTYMNISIDIFRTIFKKQFYLYYDAD